MVWWLVIAAVIAAALAYGYWDHTKQSRHLARLFAVLAAKHQGQVTAASLLALPQLRFETDGRKVLVAALATSGAEAPDSGPFTLVDLELSFDSGQKVRIERGRAGATALVEAVAPGRHPVTGHETFDQAFRIVGGDQAFVSRLLEPRVRWKLLDSRLPQLKLRVNGRKISVHMDGIARSGAELEELIDLAVLLADYCPQRA
jgi:hypothetical protein